MTPLLSQVSTTTFQCPTDVDESLWLDKHMVRRLIESGLLDDSSLHLLSVSFDVHQSLWNSKKFVLKVLSSLLEVWMKFLLVLQFLTLKVRRNQKHANLPKDPVDVHHLHSRVEWSPTVGVCLSSSGPQVFHLILLRVVLEYRLGGSRPY